MRNMRWDVCRFFMLWMLAMTMSCSKDMDIVSIIDGQRDDIISVGGIDTSDEMTVETRAGRESHPAEEIPWLVQPLESGLDITYGLFEPAGGDKKEDVAILKLTDTETNPATYTFKYLADRSATVGAGNDAIWHNNGLHYFQGVHVPERIRYTSDISEVEGSGKAPGLVTDQWNDKADGEDEELGNYTLLSHYLGMPANFNVTATIERIKLPFRHRLARVVAFVLIDPVLNTTLKGYQLDANGKDDPRTTSLRFNNVFVLEGVKDVESGGHHTLTPKWRRARKVIPHFDGVRGSYRYSNKTQLDDDFKMYISPDKKKEVYPTTSNWKTIHDKSGHDGYTEVNYGKVPVYDIIVRPTYTRVDSVMYDEENYATQTQALANATNYIDFEIELENGLRYEKRFEFDLNANYQTVVYLRISREQVDYNDAGSEVWTQTTGNDDWYGVDNDNGNTLSFAGSSWQRAYRTKKLPETDKVTDGDLYDNGENMGQYLNSNAKWTELLLQACHGGKHHGDYFVLDNDIIIDARQIPKDFVFTGHLDAQDYTITLTGTNTDAYDETAEYSPQPTHYKATPGDTYHAFEMPELYINEEVAQSKPFGKRVMTASADIPAGEGKMTRVTPTLDEVMKNEVVYFTKSGSTYTVWDPRTWTFYNHRISAGSLFCGLNGTYTTAQESNPSIKVWEANVHRETNKTTVWVPTPGYRAEVLNAVIQGGTLFPSDATVTGNVQNCFNVTGERRESVTNTPNIPQYKQ